MSMSDWNIVTRSMRTRTFSSIVTILSVAIAVGLVTLLISMRDAGENSFKRGTGNVQMLISKEAGPGATQLLMRNEASSDGAMIALVPLITNGSEPTRLVTWIVFTLLGEGRIVALSSTICSGLLVVKPV